MKNESQNYHRSSMRLKGYDYSLPGAYFITLVTHQRECLFGEVVDGEMQVNQLGKIVEFAWMDLPAHYPQVTLEAFVIMPNHVHGIVVIKAGDDDYRRGGSETHPHKISIYGLPEIVRAFKSFSARRINQIRNTKGVAVWQRSFYDHIIRDDRDYRNIWEYIETNQLKWGEDEFHAK